MATRLYLVATEPPVIPGAVRGVWDDTSGYTDCALDTAKAGATHNRSVAETNTSTTWDVLLLRGVSAPLDAQTIDGTYNCAIGVSEGNISADFYWHQHVYVMAPDGSVRGTLLSDYAENTSNEWPNTTAGRALQSDQTLSAVAAQAGDRIVAELGYIARNSSATSFTGTIQFGGVGATDQSAGGAAGNPPWIEFSDTITFSAETEPGSRWYLQNAAGAITPTPAGAWDDTASAITKALGKGTQAGANTTIVIAEAVNDPAYDVLWGTWVSDPLGAQTISGWVDLIYAAIESASAMDATLHVHLWVSQGDTSTPRGTLIANYVEGTSEEFSLSTQGRAFRLKQTVSSVVAQTGDRLVLEVGYRSPTADTTSRSATLRYGGTGGTLKRGSSTSDSLSMSASLTFDQNVLLQSEVPTSDPYPRPATILPKSRRFLDNRRGKATFSPLPKRLTETLSEDRIQLVRSPFDRRHARRGRVRLGIPPREGVRLYLNNETAPVVPAAFRGAWDDTAQCLTRRLSVAKAGVVAETLVTEIVATTGQDVVLWRGVSPPLAAQTVQGNANVVIGARETHAGADAHWHLHAYVMAPDGSVRGTLLTDYTEAAGTNELPTTQQGWRLAAAQTLTPVAASAGDRIVVEIGAVFRNATDTEYGAEIAYGGTGEDLRPTSTAVTTEVPYLDLDRSITFAAETATVQRWYLTNSPAPLIPATVKANWEQTGGAVARMLAKTPAGAAATNGVAESVGTADQDVLVGRWVSEALATQTISGTVDLVVATACDAGAAGLLATSAHLWVTQGDTDTIRGVLLDNYVLAQALDDWGTAGPHAWPTAQTLTSVAVQAGDRLVLELGYRADNELTFAVTGTVYYGGGGDLEVGSASATAGSPSLRFSSTILTADVPAVGANVVRLAHPVRSEGRKRRRPAVAPVSRQRRDQPPPPDTGRSMVVLAG